jgi:anti-sigma factor RsiW
METETPCAAYRDAIVASVDARLDQAAQQALDAHLASCARCRAVLAGHLAVQRQVRDLGFGPVSADFASRVRQRVERPPLTDLLDFRAWTWRLAPIAAVLALLIVLPAWRDRARTVPLADAIGAWATGAAGYPTSLLLDPATDPAELAATAFEERAR